ncbi:TPA: sugar transferase [Klebsiella pneumoniae]
MSQSLTCFKAYDIRGQLGEELNNDIAYRVGRAYGEFLQPKSVVVGGDIRLTSEELKLALAEGLRDAGVNVLDIGVSGTEEIYFATFHLGLDGGIEVTASHNPMDYNGMKLVRSQAKPISGDTGLRDIQRLAEDNNFAAVDPTRRGSYETISIEKEYVDHLLSYVNTANFKPLKLDELPQFVNVLKGDMSIVGPRPHAVAHNEQYRKLINGYMLRHKMKPGITGWAQINGWRGETDTLEKMQKRVEFDLDYIRNWSVWLDIKIVFLTIFKGFINKAAY